MAIKYPDILEHNNPNYALVDSNQIRGYAIVDSVLERDSIPEDKRIEGMQVTVNNTHTSYIYSSPDVGDTAWTNSSNWILAGGSSNDARYVNVTGDTMTGDLTVNANMTVTGDLYVSGTTTYINTEDLNISDNLITINSGETGSGVTNLTSGLRVDRGSETPYYFIFDEISDTFRVGSSTVTETPQIVTSGDTQAVATREDAPNDAAIAYWNDSENRFDTNSNITISGNNIVTSGLVDGVDISNFYDSYTNYTATTAYDFQDVLDNGSVGIISTDFTVVNSAEDITFVVATTGKKFEVNGGGDINLSVGGDITLFNGGYMNLESTQNISIIGSGITLNSDYGVLIFSGLTATMNDTSLLSIDSNGYVYISNTDYYTSTQIDNNFLSANTSFYTENEVDSYFLSANTIRIVVTSNGSGYVPEFNSTELTNSFVFGIDAGYQSTGTSNSTFIGQSAGYQSDATHSTFIGYQAGYQADNISYSNFLGQYAGYQSDNSYRSNFLGRYSGRLATGSYHSNFMGESSGYYATGSYYSNYLGNYAGYSAVTSHNSNFLGNNAGRDAINTSYSNFLGYYAGYGAVNSNNSIFIGESTGREAIDADRSIFLGAGTGFKAFNASYSTFIGSLAGYQASGSTNSIFIGRQAGYQDIVNNTTEDYYSILIGPYTSTSGYSNSIVLGSGIASSYAKNTMSNQLMIGSGSRPINYLNIRGINYEVPSLQGSSGTILTNDGTGILTWESVSSPSIYDLSGLTATDIDNNFLSANTSLSGLSDVSLSGLTDGQNLTWSDSEQKWINDIVPSTDFAYVLYVDPNGSDVEIAGRGAANLPYLTLEAARDAAELLILETIIGDIPSGGTTIITGISDEDNSKIKEGQYIGYTESGVLLDDIDVIGWYITVLSKNNEGSDDNSIELSATIGDGTEYTGATINIYNLVEIKVMAGNYEVTTTATTGLAIDGLTWNFNAGTTIVKNTTNSMFYMRPALTETNWRLGYNVIGYGNFIYNSSNLSTNTIFYAHQQSTSLVTTIEFNTCNFVGGYSAIFTGGASTSLLPSVYIKGNTIYSTTTAMILASHDYVNINTVICSSTFKADAHTIQLGATAIVNIGKLINLGSGNALMVYGVSSSTRIIADIAFAVASTGYALEVQLGTYNDVNIKINTDGNIKVDSSGNRVTLAGNCNNLYTYNRTRVHAENLTVTRVESHDASICNTRVLGGGTFIADGDDTKLEVYLEAAEVRPVDTGIWFPYGTVSNNARLVINGNASGNIIQSYHLIKISTGGELIFNGHLTVYNSAVSAYVREVFRINEGTLRFGPNARVNLLETDLGVCIVKGYTNGTTGKLILDSGSILTTANSVIRPIIAEYDGLETKFMGIHSQNLSTTNDILKPLQYSSTITITGGTGTGGDTTSRIRINGTYCQDSSDLQSDRCQQIYNIINASGTTYHASDLDLTGSTFILYGDNVEDRIYPDLLLNASLELIQPSSYELQNDIGGILIAHPDVE